MVHHRVHMLDDLLIFLYIVSYIFKNFFPILQYMPLGSEIQFPDFGQQKPKCVPVSS